jgi:hypothetical protein
MPVYRARLEATDGSGEFRVVACEAASEEEAKKTILGLEDRYVFHRLDTNELAELEAAEKAAKKTGEPLTAEQRRSLAFHRQTEPYKIVHIGKEDPPLDPNRKPAELRRGEK